jgi:hypothetical protein
MARAVLATGLVLALSGCGDDAAPADAATDASFDAPAPDAGTPDAMPRRLGRSR